MKTRVLWLLTITAVTAGCGAMPGGGGAKKLHALFDREWEYLMQEEPVMASSQGDRRYNDRWEDLSLDAIARRHEHNLGVLDELKKFDRARLTDADRLNLRLFRRQYEQSVELHPYGWYRVPLTQRDGIQTLDQVADALRFTTVRDYEEWIARLEKLPPYMDQTIALMRDGIATGVLHARVVMERVPNQIRQQITDEEEKSPFFRPFTRFPAEIAEADRARLTESAKAAIRDGVVPAYRKFETFFVKEYLPACHDEVGAWQLPRGREMYAAFARMHTTTDLTPEQIHQIGLDEVARIRGEMMKVITEVKFAGTFDEFLVHLRTDKKFYFDDPGQLLDAYRALSKRIDPYLVNQFRTMPRMPYGVEPIPDSIAPDTTTAYYRGPAADGSRAGTYFVNLFKPEVRPKYEMEALSLHEAVPGHHFQIALAMEQGELPKFRRHSHFTAYIEGWGLYAESLGGELGCYADPYSKFGQLTYEMWRACRLVVDTGMHHHGWSRQKAIDYMKANAAKSEQDIVNEIDRYIAWPGQALAYKIGELKIKELKARAASELGEKFDVRDFHDVVLLSGAVPLDVLEENVNEWIHKAATGGRGP